MQVLRVVTAQYLHFFHVCVWLHCHQMWFRHMVDVPVCHHKTFSVSTSARRVQVSLLTLMGSGHLVVDVLQLVKNYKY